MRTLSIDINCDLAEGIGNEKELMPWITSANIACGYHAGNKELMKQTVDLCLKYNVSIGAHPSFPDRKNFGRTNMEMPLPKVHRMVSEQIELLKKIAETHGARLHHVKPHGALYNRAAKDPALANVIARAVLEIDNGVILYGLSQSFLMSEGVKLNLKTANEVFADRTYQPDGSLTPRTQPNALITRGKKALEQAIRLVKENKVRAVTGKDIQLMADTICLHGDGLHAVEFARLIFAGLTRDEIEIKTVS